MPHRVVAKETAISLKECEFTKEMEMNFILPVAQVTWKNPSFPNRNQLSCDLFISVDVLLLRYKRPAGAG